MTSQRVVVVGAGIAGLRSVEALRKAGFAGELVVVGDELVAPYNRPPLSKAALRGGATHASLAFRQRAGSEDVDWRLGDAVVAADLSARRLRLASGGELDYDALVAATGVSARRLPVPGPPADHRHGRHVVRTVDDAVELGSELRPGADVVVVGAGFIGCEVAATARSLGCEVTCVSVDPHPMVRPLGTELAAELQRRHESQGVRFRLRTGVRAFTGTDRVNGVDLDDGTHLPADVVVEAVGSRCNTAWLGGNGLDLSDGVLTDGALRPLTAAGDGSPVPEVAVVGDIARFPHRLSGVRAVRTEHWGLAGDTARRAAAVLTARLRGSGYEEIVAAPWDVLPSFWSDQYDLRIQSFGLPGAATDVRLLEGPLDGACVMGYFDGEALVGVVGIDATRTLTAYRELLTRPAAVV